MPFDSSFDSVFQYVIKPIVEGLGHKCIRVDNIFQVGSILKDIYESIRNADYIIADISLPNPNVYYELGFAHALNKKVILITKQIESLPFDLKHERVIKYEDSIRGTENLKSSLLKFI